MNVTCRVSGRYRLDVRDTRSGATRSTGWFANLVTDQGLDMLAQGPADFLRYCQVGTGSATPAAGDVALGAGAASAAYTAQENRIDATDHYIALRVEYLFAAGSVDASVTEVGVGPVDDALSTSLFSRALTPAPVAVGASDELRVYYEYRVYQPVVDSVVSVDGIEVTVRGAYTDDLRDNLGWWLGLGHYRMLFHKTGVVTRLSDGPINDHTAGISATGALSAEQVTDAAYVPGSFERQVTFVARPEDYNGSIQSMEIVYGPGCLQFGFNPAIAKSDYQELTLGFTFRWARRP